MQGHFRYSVLTLMLAFLVLSVVCGVGSMFYRTIAGTEGAAVTPQAANSNLAPRLVLPMTAKDINFYRDMCWVEADFSISEDEFLKWCKTRNWTILDAANEEIVFTRARTASDAHLGSHRVVDGVGVKEFYLVVAFDNKLKRASVWRYTCAPKPEAVAD